MSELRALLDSSRQLLQRASDQTGEAIMMANEFRRMADHALSLSITLSDALEESVKLQSHYAMLLNQLDGGKRLRFANGQAWLNRIAECKAAAKNQEVTNESS